MKRFLTFALIIAAVFLSGCAKKAPQVKAVFVPENDIITYDKVDPDKTALLVSTMGDESAVRFSKAFEAKNPDVQIVPIDITGGSAFVSPVIEWVKNGYAPDIMFDTAGLFTDDLSLEYFVNLSDDPATTLFSAETMSRMDINGNVYMLPGPSNLSCMIYNKTLFEKYSWTVPSSFDEFVELCLKIREDTNGEIEPWNPNAKYSNEILTALEGFTYDEVFAGLDNRTWLNGLATGESKLTGHMEPFYAVMKRLIDEGILREEHFSYSATTRGKEFAAGKIAMVNNSVNEYDNDEFDFGYMPFPSTTGGVGYVAQTDSKVLHVPKKEHTEKELDAIKRYLDFFATVEGQRAYIGDLLMVSNLDGVEANQSEDLKTLQPSIDAGRRFTRINFSGPYRTHFSPSTDAISMIKGEKTPEQCLIDADAEHFAETEVPQEIPPVLATAEKDFSTLETSFYLADMYREKAEADIGLINHSVAFRGNLMRIFAGELNRYNVETLKPRSFGNDATLEKLEMTGAQLIAALNAPQGKDAATNSVYAYSGLKCELAPWNEPGKKYLSVTMADGSKIDEAKVYTVAAWKGTVADEFVKGVADTYEGKFEELLTEKLEKDKKISPTRDGRCKIRWD